MYLYTKLTKQQVLISVLILIIVSCTQKTQKAEIKRAPEIPEEWLVYEKRDYLLRYPESWQIRNNFEKTDVCVLSMPTTQTDVFRENITLVIEVLPKNIQIDEYSSRSLREIEKKYTITGRKKYETNGQEYYQIRFKGRDGLHSEQHYVVQNKAAYILTFSYDPKASEEIIYTGQKILGSFRLKM